MGAQSRAYGIAMRRVVEQACKALVLEINRELRKSGSGTPVDTGHARANWVPSVGQPYDGEHGPAVAALDAAEGAAAVLSFKLGDGALYITNNVPYLNALNYGHSKQAPRLFIEACVDRAIAKVQARFEGRIDLDRVAILGSSAGGMEYLGGELAGNMADAYSPFD